MLKDKKKHVNFCSKKIPFQNFNLVRFYVNITILEESGQLTITYMDEYELMVSRACIIIIYG